MSAAKKLSLRPMQLPAYQEFTTSNGLRTLICPRGPIPLVSIRLVLKSGSSSDPEGKEGLTDFATRLLRRGTKSMSADALNERVEFVGGSLGASVAEDLSLLAITAPAQELGNMLDVIAQLVTEPAFAEEEVARARQRALAHLANDLDDPSLVADKGFTEALWGGHPYGHDLSGRKQSVASFTREDVVALHADRFKPDQAMLIIVGPVDQTAARNEIERAFAGFSGSSVERLVPPSPARAAGSGEVLLIDKPDQTQSQIRLGCMAFPKAHPDRMPAVVMNTALGGGFTSRLVNEIRVKRGLAYGAGSHFDGLLHGGSFVVASSTKSGSTAELIEVALKEVEKMRKKGPTPAELDTAKRYLAGLYPLRLETNESISGALAEVQFYGLGADWIEGYRERLHAVTLSDAKKVAALYLFPEAPAITVVGAAQDVAKQLERFGKVRIVPAADYE